MKRCRFQVVSYAYKGWLELVNRMPDDQHMSPQSFKFPVPTYLAVAALPRFSAMVNRHISIVGYHKVMVLSQQVIAPQTSRESANTPSTTRRLLPFKDYLKKKV